MKIIFYTNTRNPVGVFIDAMSQIDQVRVLGSLKNIEDLGFASPRVQFRQIKGKLWEIKIHAPNAGYRFFYVTVNQETLVLLHAYKKQSQKAPNKEIAIAEKRLLKVLKNESHYIK